MLGQRLEDQPTSSEETSVNGGNCEDERDACWDGQLGVTSRAECKRDDGEVAGRQSRAANTRSCSPEPKKQRIAQPVLADDHPAREDYAGSLAATDTPAPTDFHASGLAADSTRGCAARDCSMPKSTNEASANGIGGQDPSSTILHQTQVLCL